MWQRGCAWWGQRDSSWQSPGAPPAPPKPGVGRVEELGGSAVPSRLRARTTTRGVSLTAFERGHCYEPYIQNGNFTTSDPTYNLGTTVEFTCDPGHSLEQGPAVIECVNMRDPYWNDTEPLCRGE